MMQIGGLSVGVALLALTGCVPQPGDGSRPAGPEDGPAWEAKFASRGFAFGGRDYAVKLTPVDLAAPSPAGAVLNRAALSTLELTVSRADGTGFTRSSADRVEAGRVGAAYCRHLGFVAATAEGGTAVFLSEGGRNAANVWRLRGICHPPAPVARALQ